MKKFLSTLFVTLYIVMSSGIMISFHYCMGSLADWEFGTLAHCSSCAHKDGLSCNCCSMQTEFIKLAADQKTEHTHVADFTPVVLDLLADLWENHLLSDVKEAQSLTFRLDSDFRRDEVPIFIHNCLFLI